MMAVTIMVPKKPELLEEHFLYQTDRKKKFKLNRCHIPYNILLLVLGFQGLKCLGIIYVFSKPVR